MPETSVQLVGMDEIRQYLSVLPGRAFDQAREAFDETAKSVHRKVSDRVRDGAGGTLHSRTGQLRRSLRYKVYGSTLKTLGAHVYSAREVASYAPVHELGATIRAKNAYRTLAGGPYLNIPSNFNKTAAGVQRLPAREVFMRGGYIVPLSGARKARYMVMLDGKPYFWLVKEVTIPPRLRMIATAEDEVPTLLSRLREGTQRTIDA